MRSDRSGALIAGTWLIGLGIVFLVRQAADLEWREAWPLFVILVGVASVVSTAVRSGLGIAGFWSLTWPIAWIVVGIVLLLATTGSLGPDPGSLVATWWPWALIVLGVWFLIGALVPGGSQLVEQLALPLEGASEANVRIRFGGGTLTSRAAAAGNLVDGDYRGGVRHRLRGPGRVELDHDTSRGLPWLDRRTEWTVGLTTEVPLDLTLETGASRTVLDLGELRVRSLDLRSGASETRVILPRAAGLTTVRAETGAASLAFDVPAGVAARIRSRMALGSSQIDEARFPRSGDAYESPDFASATNRVEIDVRGGVGSLRVTGSP
jgi:hypothetical protein